MYYLSVTPANLPADRGGNIDSRFSQEYFPRTPMVPFISARTTASQLGSAGFRTGDKGTHTSRTMMLAELQSVLDSSSDSATRADYASAIIEGNCLNKPTASTRRLSNQRLGELYGLDPTVPIFRALRRLWFIDPASRPQLALLVALARDPLLLASANAVVALTPGEEYRKDPVRRAVAHAVQDRLNDATLDKVVRNVSSSWEQSGHLVGRTFKRRLGIEATPASVALAMYIAYLAGHRGEELLDSPWTRVLDANRAQTTQLALSAKRLGLIDIRIADRVVDMSFRRLDPSGSVE
jgi:hypothetical protein